jgi:hypothetical protein
MKKNYKLFATLLLSLSSRLLEAQCPLPTSVTALPSSICAGQSTTLNATAAGASIGWYNVPTGGTLLGSSTSGANIAFTPTTTTTYYAESFSTTIGGQTFNFSGAIQNFTVPAGVTSVTIITRGARGGGSTQWGATAGGNGAIIQGNFTVTPGQVLRVLVGGQGATAQNVGGGGGGSFVWDNLTNTLYSAAGGGGGAGTNWINSTGIIGVSAVTGTNATNGLTVTNGAGSAGNGGTIPSGYTYYASGGAGWLTNGNNGTTAGCTFNSTGGTRPLLGGMAGIGGGDPGTAANGGFGGGGGGNARCGAVGGGGGGGYSGGGAGAENGTNDFPAGGGGASYNIGTSQINTVGNTGNGVVTFSWNPISCTSASRTPVSVTVNALPTISVTSGAVCQGSSFTITPSGASTYTFSSGSAVVSPTTTTNYSVTGTSGLGCVSSNTAVSTVTINASPTLAVNSGTICSGSTFTIVPSGANTYTIQGGSTAVTPTANASYTVIGTSTAGCVSANTATSNVTVNALPSVTVTGNTAICGTGTNVLNASGANTYSWNTGATTSSISISPTVTTNYTVVGTLSLTGCALSTTLTQNVGLTPTVTAVSSNTDFICSGSTATLTVAGASSYVWNTTATTAVIAISPTTTTSYTVTGTNAAGCSATAVISQSVSTCTGINSNFTNLTSNLIVYPNPSSRVFNVQLENSTSLSLTTIEVTDVLGRVILTDNVNAGVYELNLGNNVNGVYFIKATFDGKTKTVKIIKE